MGTTRGRTTTPCDLAGCQIVSGTPHVRIAYDDELGITIPTHLVNGTEQTTKIQARSVSDYVDVARFDERGVSDLQPWRRVRQGRLGIPRGASVP